MLMEQTLQTLNALRLPGMAAAFAEQQSSAAAMSSHGQISRGDVPRDTPGSRRPPTASSAGAAMALSVASSMFTAIAGVLATSPSTL